jgi:hypothetical protein
MPASAILLCLLITLGSSIITSTFRIRVALTQNLHDALDVNHVQILLLQVTIE